MGNAVSGTTGESLVTASMAKYMTITKPQIITLRNLLLPLASNRRGSIHRSNLRHALHAAEVANVPDQEVIDLLFTMWDMTGSGRVACVEFVIGLSVLACKEDSIETAIRFALQVADKNRSGKISSKDASAFLRSVCATATYFGDRPLALRQIYKIVDTMFGSSTNLSSEDGELAHDEFVRLLTEQESVQDVVCVKGKKPQRWTKQNTMSPTIRVEPDPPKTALDRLQERFQQDENLETICSNSLIDSELEPHPTEAEVEEEEESVTDEKSESVSANYSTDYSSHMSSVQLTPLAKITISSNQSWQQQPAQSLQAALQTKEPTLQKSNRPGLMIPWMRSKSVHA